MSAFIADSFERKLFTKGVRDLTKSFRTLPTALQEKAMRIALGTYAAGTRVVELEFSGDKISRISVHHPRLGLLVIDIDAEAA